MVHGVGHVQMAGGSQPVSVTIFLSPNHVGCKHSNFSSFSIPPEVDCLLYLSGKSHLKAKIISLKVLLCLNSNDLTDVHQEKSEKRLLTRKVMMKMWFHDTKNMKVGCSQESNASM
jgi:hypothetical protein